MSTSGIMPIGARLFLLVGAVASLHHAEEEEEELGASARDEETGQGFLFSPTLEVLI